MPSRAACSSISSWLPRLSVWNFAAASSITRHCGSAVSASTCSPICSCRAAIFAARAASAASRCAGLSCGRRLRLALPVRLLLVALAALLFVLLVLVIWTLPELEPKPGREELRNRCPATHSPGPSGTELCSGAGSGGGGRPDQACFRSAAPEGRKDLGWIGWPTRRGGGWPPPARGPI